MRNQSCPCCGDILLNCTRNKQVYLFCRGCWQEMPNVDKGVGVSLKGSTQVTSIATQFQ
ncbi:MAG: hypothetical protein AAF378_19080 [Cyanobacteria bacterium P01_A01_bin.84]